MPRIAKSEHPKIRLMVEAEQRAVPEVAELYGCSPANIYAIISRLRRDEAKAPEALPSLELPDAAPAPAPAKDLFSVAGDAGAAVTSPPNAPTRGGGSDPAFPPPLVGGEGGGAGTRLDVGAGAAPPPPPAPTLVSDRGARGKSGQGSAVGGKLAKPGFGFHMRTSDGEESVAPFRSLEDLLSAAKNILRGAARSPEPVWFSIQPLDLASIDSEAA